MKNIIIKLFNLEPDDIKEIDILSRGLEAFVFITLSLRFHPCPKCNLPTTRIKDYYNRTISHPILNGINTTIIYRRRRLYCPHCGHFFMEESPFSTTGRRISKYTILRVMSELKDYKTTFSKVAINCDISETTVRRIFDEHAIVPDFYFPEVMCIDEVYTNKHTQQVYACVLLDFETREVIELLPQRKKYYLMNYFTKFPEEMRNTVKYVCIDMWEPYRDVSKLLFKNAKICADPFHVIKLVNYAFNKVRIRIMNEFESDTEEYYLLKKFPKLLLKDYDSLENKKNIKIYKKISFMYTNEIEPQALILAMLEISPELEAAYALKEDLRKIYKNATADNAGNLLDGFYDDVRLIGIPEFINCMTTMKKWNDEIINSFDSMYGRRISNGALESVNSRIKNIKRNANGYRRFERFRKRVLYSLNKKSNIKF